MAREIPSAPKVYTTVYDNFRGVDFTNDSTNVWRRRSPSGVNMLPDASGRPMKRNGWEILLPNSSISEVFGKDSCSIMKCVYFELAGKDHLVVFTNEGVLFYNGEDTGVGITVDGVTAYSTEKDIYTSYDRCFFFEGNGMSAFYIYGNFRVWRYSYDNGYVFEEVTDLIKVPRVLTQTSADGAGTPYEAYNLLGNLIQVEYTGDTDLFAYWGTDGLDFSVDKATFTTAHPKNYAQLYKCTDGANNTWEDESHTTVTLSSLGIVVSSPNTDDVIFVVNANGIMLPNNFDVGSQGTSMSVWSTTNSQFDTLLTQNTSTALSTGEYCPHSDKVERENKQTWVEFYVSDDYTGSGDDTIRVEYPSTEVVATQIGSVGTPIQASETTQTALDGEVI